MHTYTVRLDRETGTFEVRRNDERFRHPEFKTTGLTASEAISLRNMLNRDAAPPQVRGTAGAQPSYFRQDGTPVFRTRK